MSNPVRGFAQSCGASSLNCSAWSLARGPDSAAVNSMSRTLQRTRGGDTFTRCVISSAIAGDRAECGDGWSDS
jgi:hypothetical protein